MLDEDQMEEKEQRLKNLVKGEKIKILAKKKKDKYNYITVPKKKINFYLSDGWEIKKKYKNSVRLRKPKILSDALEDEMWYILVSMGYKEMNIDNNFRIPVPDNPDIPPKQIDVFAKDDETVLIVECKSSETIDTKRSFSKDITEIVALRENIIKSIQQYYGRKPKLKFGWIFATRNIAWSDNDTERAADANITIISDDNIDYYKELIKHLGIVAKYQLLGEVFSKQDIPGLKLAVPALKGEMGGYHYYAFNIEPAKLLRIAYISHRAKMDKTTLVSYQRMLKKSRLKKIQGYIENNGIFPTSIVINLDSGKRKLRFGAITHHEDAREIFGILHLPCYYKSCWVIDGQHRLYGFSGSEYAEKVTVPVIAFENLPSPQQASMFVDINHEQVRVSSNLLVDLYSDLFFGSPDVEKNLRAIISKIVRELRMDIGSPLRNRIAIVGSKRTQEQALTVYSVYAAIANANLIGKSAKGNRFLPGPLSDKDDESMIKRAKAVISAYLNEFEEALPKQWEAGSGPGGYICTNGGVTALTLVLKAITDHLDKLSSVNCYEMPTNELIEAIKPYANPIITMFQSASPEEIYGYRSRLGSAGHRDSAYSMMIEINKKFEDFNPPGLDDFIGRRSSAFNVEARNKTYEIQTKISKYIIRKLMENFNEDGEQWWSEGVPLRVRQQIAQRREEDPERGEYKKYFLLVHYKDIVSANWELFKDKFSFESTGKKEKQLSWLIELNRIRNKVFHPEKGIATKEELDFLDDILNKINEKQIS